MAPPVTLSFVEARQDHTSDGFEISHTLESVGSNGVRALTSSFGKRTDCGDTYILVNQATTYFYNPGSAKPDGTANYTMLMYGKKGTVSGDKRVGDQIDTFVMIDGKFYRRWDRKIDVRLNFDEYNGLSTEELAKKLLAEKEVGYERQ